MKDSLKFGSVSSSGSSMGSSFTVQRKSLGANFEVSQERSTVRPVAAAIVAPGASS